MTLDPRRLKPAELVRLVNSTPLGAVLNERQLYRQRARAGYRVGEGKTVDLLRYTAWLVTQRHAPKPEPERLSGYDALKERSRQRNAQLSLSGRDIGELPAFVNPERRARAQRNFRFFCERYFAQTFHLPWSEDHLKVIAKIELAVLEGGLFAMAMPRGSGKTSLCETACLWALVYGHREFVALIGADEEHAESMLDSLKVELETNERLLEDFPEVCFPIRCLEGIHQRAAGQIYQGKPTHIGWTAKKIVLPTIENSAACGTLIWVAGITGRIRGMKHKRADGTSIRPSLVLIDDPMTDEASRSPSQCMTREQLLNGAILGLAGPGKKIAGLMTLTVVRPGDLADRILDREKHPQWQGERTKLVYSLPTNENLWNKYSELWREGLRTERGTGEATAFYLHNREAMDAGAKVAWPARYNPDEQSALQHAMNLRLDRGEAAFWAEYQNEPLPEQQADEELLTADQLMARINGYDRGEIPVNTVHLTAFIDVQAKALFWLVAAWEEDFTGYVVDYGTEPDQKRQYFTLRDICYTLADACPKGGLEGTIYAGLERLTERLCCREWRRDDGALLHLDRCLIDANWGQSSDLVYQFCRQCQHAGIVLPSHGRYVGASSIPFSEYTRKPGDRIGLNWRMPVTSAKRSIRHALFDTNYWKSFIQVRLAVPLGDPSSLSFFGRKPEQHRLLADHLTSEYRVPTQGRGRTVDEWKLRADGRDNHWLDGLTGAAVAASMQGAAPPGLVTEKRPPRRSYAERYAEWKRHR